MVGVGVTAEFEIYQIEDDDEDENEDDRLCLWSGWRGFGPVRVDWLLKYRRTGGNRVGNIKRTRQEGALRGSDCITGL
ncbi:MAG: hypothetical protein K0Q55_2200 [Verrucomicrobia bacterium]|jgi:hypothetical protein|nr:hypothetical protein [Verrucomicrobiota bacterium]